MSRKFSTLMNFRLLKPEYIRKHGIGSYTSIVVRCVIHNDQRILSKIWEQSHAFRMIATEPEREIEQYVQVAFRLAMDTGSGGI